MQLQLAPEQRVDPQALVSIVLAAVSSDAVKSYFQVKGHTCLKGYLNKWMTNYLTKCYSNYSFQNTKLFYCYVFKLCKEHKILGLTCRECLKFATKAYKEPKDELTRLVTFRKEIKCDLLSSFFFMYSSTAGVFMECEWNVIRDN